MFLFEGLSTLPLEFKHMKVIHLNSRRWFVDTGDMLQTLKMVVDFFGGLFLCVIIEP